MATFQTDDGENGAKEKSAKEFGAPNILQRITRYRSGKTAQSAVNRRHKRHGCSCLGSMAFINRSYMMEGIITEISRGGLKFRPAKMYLLERKDTQVLFEFSNFRLSGKIVATRSDGYGIALFDEIEDDTLEMFLAEFGHEDAAEFVQAAAANAA